MKCKVKDCESKVLSKEMCSKHYYRVKRGGTAEVSLKQQMALRQCSIAGCEKSHLANGFCAAHNKRLQRHGDPNFVNPKCNRDGNYIKRARAKTAQWKKDNWIYYKAYLKARKHRVKQATPIWADLNAIQEFYHNCPKGYHVDHIIPLNGSNVSGLHILSNLQYLPALANLQKSNKVAA